MGNLGVGGGKGGGNEQRGRSEQHLPLSVSCSIAHSSPVFDRKSLRWRGRGWGIIWPDREEREKGGEEREKEIERIKR